MDGYGSDTRAMGDGTADTLTSSSETYQALSSLERYSLHVSAVSLADCDTFSKSDPFFVMYESLENPPTVWNELARSETVWDDLSPKWARSLQFAAHTSARTSLHFVVYDNDKRGSSNLSDHDCIGHCTVRWPTLLEAPDATLDVPLTNPNHARPGTLRLFLDRILPSPLSIQLRFSFGAHVSGRIKRAFVVLSRTMLNADRTFMPVYRSDVICVGRHVFLPPPAVAAPAPMSRDFEPHSMSEEDACGGDDRADLMVEVFSHARLGNHTLLGRVYTTLARVSMGKLPVVCDATPVPMSRPRVTMSRVSTESVDSQVEPMSGYTPTPGSVAVLPRSPFSVVARWRPHLSRNNTRAHFDTSYHPEKHLREASQSKPALIVHSRRIHDADENKLCIAIKLLNF